MSLFTKKARSENGNYSAGQQKAPGYFSPQDSAGSSELQDAASAYPSGSHPPCTHIPLVYKNEYVCPPHKYIFMSQNVSLLHTCKTHIGKWHVKRRYKHGTIFLPALWALGTGFHTPRLEGDKLPAPLTLGLTMGLTWPMGFCGSDPGRSPQ